MSCDWTVVTLHHVRQACVLFDAGNAVPTRPPRNTFLLIGGKRYPAKFIRGLAYKLATGTKPGVYHGGAQTVDFFGRLGLTTEYHGAVVAPSPSAPSLASTPTPTKAVTPTTPQVTVTVADAEVRVGDATEGLAHICDQLIHPARLYAWAEVSEKRTLVPKKPGLYAWWFAEVPPGVPTAGTVEHGGHRLLYVGISPKDGKSKSNLRKRVIRSHFGGNASGSTLRLTLGCLLGGRLGIRLQPTGSTGRLTFAGGEAKLTQWMAQNALVSWVEHPEPWVVEAHAIASLCLPLNLGQNQRSPFHRELTILRGRCKAAARSAQPPPV